MKKVMKIIATLFVASLILTSCGGNSQEGEPHDKPNENVKKPDPNITYSLKEALANDFIKISADGIKKSNGFGTLSYSSMCKSDTICIVVAIILRVKLSFNY